MKNPRLRNPLTSPQLRRVIDMFNRLPIGGKLTGIQIGQNPGTLISDLKRGIKEIGGNWTIAPAEFLRMTANGGKVYTYEKVRS